MIPPSLPSHPTNEIRPLIIQQLIHQQKILSRFHFSEHLSIEKVEKIAGIIFDQLNAYYSLGTHFNLFSDKKVIYTFFELKKSTFVKPSLGKADQAAASVYMSAKKTMLGPVYITFDLLLAKKRYKEAFLYAKRQEFSIQYDLHFLAVWIHLHGIITLLEKEKKFELLTEILKELKSFPLVDFWIAHLSEHYHLKGQENLSEIMDKLILENPQDTKENEQYAAVLENASKRMTTRCMLLLILSLTNQRSQPSFI